MATEKGVGRHLFAAGPLHGVDSYSALAAGHHDALFVIFEDGIAFAGG